MSSLRLVTLVALLTATPLTTADVSSKAVQYSKDRLTSEEIRNICDSISIKKNQSSVQQLIQTFAQRRQVDTSYVVNDLFAKYQCINKYPQNNTIITYSMHKDSDNFKALAMSGFNPRKQLKDSDGVFKYPFVMIKKKIQTSTDIEDKKRWNRVSLIINSLNS